LFSAHHLSPDELAEAARRVRQGEAPDPSRALRQEARVAMGAQPPTDTAREPLPLGHLLLLGLANVVLTPLVGYATWFGFRDERPIAARQALAVTVPTTVGLAVVWVAIVMRGVFP
jgi:hypothetical protein